MACLRVIQRVDWKVHLIWMDSHLAYLMVGLKAYSTASQKWRDSHWAYSMGGLMACWKASERLMEIHLE